MAIFIDHKTDRQQIQALARCKQPDNEALLALLRHVLEETKVSLVSASDQVRLHRLQGRAELIIDFLESVEKSVEILAKS
jgi:hypothetical protein